MKEFNKKIVALAAFRKRTNGKPTKEELKEFLAGDGKNLYKVIKPIMTMIEEYLTKEEMEDLSRYLEK